MLLKYGNFLEDVPNGNINNSVSVFINSCGTYKLSQDKDMTTERIDGRKDYQLIYIADGQGTFFFDKNQSTVIKAGSIVIFRPDEYQKYIYFGNDKPQIYWIHFTGNNIEEILKNKISEDELNLLKNHIKNVEKFPFFDPNLQ